MSRGNTTRTDDREHDRTIRTTAAAMTSFVSLIDAIVALFGSPVQIKNMEKAQNENRKYENTITSCGGYVRGAGRTRGATSDDDYFGARDYRENNR